MKRFIIFTLMAIILGLSMTSCNKEKKAMEEILVSSLKSPSSYKCVEFETESVWTLAREVNDRLEYFTERQKSSSRDIEHYNSMLNIEKESRYKSEFTIQMYEEYLKKAREDFEKETKMIEYLNSIETDYSDIYYKLSSKTYKLTYEAANGFGAQLRDVCYGRFDKDGELVAIKLSEDDDWLLLGNFFSIPHYYEMI